jgi:hypothetical protein
MNVRLMSLADWVADNQEWMEGALISGDLRCPCCDAQIDVEERDVSQAMMDVMGCKQNGPWRSKFVHDELVAEIERCYRKAIAEEKTKLREWIGGAV